MTTNVFGALRATRATRLHGPVRIRRPPISSQSPLERGGPLAADDEAGLLESLAAEFYLIDRLDDAIDACARALRIRREQGAMAAVSADHHALAVYEWSNANRTLAEDHTARAVAVLSDDATTADAEKIVQLGHGFAMQVFMALHASDLDRADTALVRAVEIAERVEDPALRAGAFDRELLRGTAKRSRRSRGDPVDLGGGTQIRR
ncbi:hypothetical protein [Aldersonia kunmingensis]|uniref:hypothetical protein n=1 Tax=Aldersonia kunmingensis TaxID=408066 RepID=UPI0008366199|nr:hypothetical protein [Aldersonia kunmingensis]